MAEASKIEWTDSTFNPWIGCTKISPACDHCYAEALMDQRHHRVTWGGERSRTSASNWQQPRRWQKQAAAFFAEVFRGGIVSIERGQWEGARAIGMSESQVMRRVILPQAVKRMIPAFMERAIELMKTTTLVATVSYADLLFQANELAQKTFRPLEVFTVTALIYFIFIFCVSVLAHRLERRLAVSGETTVH